MVSKGIGRTWLPDVFPSVARMMPRAPLVSGFWSQAPRIAEMLIDVALDERSKPCSLVAAADLICRTIGTYLLGANLEEQIASIREQLEQKENGDLALEV